MYSGGVEAVMVLCLDLAANKNIKIREAPPGLTLAGIGIN